MNAIKILRAIRWAREDSFSGSSGRIRSVVQNQIEGEAASVSRVHVRQEVAAWEKRIFEGISQYEQRNSG